MSTIERIDGAAILDHTIDDLLLQARGLVLVREVLAQRGASPAELDAQTRELERVRRRLAKAIGPEGCNQVALLRPGRSYCNLLLQDRREERGVVLRAPAFAHRVGVPRPHCLGNTEVEVAGRVEDQLCVLVREGEREARG